VVQGHRRGRLYEELVYGDDGQLLSTSFMDYLLPTASETPEILLAHVRRAPRR